MGLELRTLDECVSPCYNMALRGRGRYEDV